MFELKEKNCTISSVTPRSELNGDEKKPAGTVRIKATCDNSILDALEPGLLNFFFKAKNENSKKDLVDEGQPGHLTELRFAKLQTGQKWNYEGAGYETIIHYGASGKGDIQIEDCGLNKFAFEIHEGGTVDIEFNINYHPNEKIAGKLSMLVQQAVTLTLIPPTDGNPQNDLLE